MAALPIQQMVAQLARLPGIGPKSALRLAYHIIGLPEEQVRELATAIFNGKKYTRHCSVCGDYTDVEPCALCADTRRTDELLCVVRDPRDVAAMERARDFRGRYHVLMGVISPMEGIGPEDIRVAELVERVKRGGVREVILATNPDVEGEATASYIAGELKPLGVTVSRIAHGVPVGGDLEYTDEITLSRAMAGRRPM